MAQFGPFPKHKLGQVVDFHWNKCQGRDWWTPFLQLQFCFFDFRQALRGCLSPWFRPRRLLACCEQQRERAAQLSKEPQRGVHSLVEK